MDVWVHIQKVDLARLWMYHKIININIFIIYIIIINNIISIIINRL